MQKVRSYLEAWEITFERTEDGDGFMVPYSSALVMLTFIPYGEDEVILDLRSFLVSDVPLSAALYRHVATTAPLMGGVHVWTDDEGSASVVYQHTLLADYLDELEFRNALTIFSLTADELDDELAATFGGTTTFDA